MASRNGFTMVELLVSLVLLAVGIVGLQLATGRFVRIAASADVRTEAAQIAADRLERIRSDPDYPGLVARYTETGTVLDDPAGLVRDTEFSVHYDSTDAGVTDFLRVTVTVDGPGLTSPVARTLSIGRP